MPDGIRCLYSTCSKHNRKNQKKNIIRAVSQARRESVCVAELVTIKSVAKHTMKVGRKESYHLPGFNIIQSGRSL